MLSAREIGALKACDDWTTMAREEESASRRQRRYLSGCDQLRQPQVSRLPFMACTIKDNLHNPTLMMDLELIQDRSLPHDFLGELDLLV